MKLVFGTGGGTKVEGGALRGLLVSLGVLTGVLGLSLARAGSKLRRLQGETERLGKMAMTDPLTGLANRRLFQMRLRQSLALARRQSLAVALIVLDLDEFKKINDLCGHPTGDMVLRAVARELRGDARAEDLVARQGGEEFAIILEGTDAVGALARAERLRMRLGRLELGIGGTRTLHVTASFGISAYPEHGEPKAENLVAKADAALYMAKASGRDTSVVWTESVRVQEPELRSEETWAEDGRGERGLS